MPKFYCDYCDTYLTHDSPSVRKTHCSGRKHKENVKDYYQKWMEEQAQSLIDKTTAAFQQGKIPPTPFSAPPPAGAMIPPPPSLHMEPRASSVLEKHSTTEPHSQPKITFFLPSLRPLRASRACCERSPIVRAGGCGAARVGGIVAEFPVRRPERERVMAAAVAAASGACAVAAR
ncbi:PREDICTED: U1 small nuclear ribonucleoprotein C [Dipodomys ordii]|uniref:U1 small nuclear ribonucleoprotein C n=1 Tax=Dipodomys ordii TaxID=10020 RepID=A0A1S3G897_DIPOR|nr:PREDICTED: U1 small nuclear ribonucleoprotein C [Dipodomys ordii]